MTQEICNSWIWRFYWCFYWSFDSTRSYKIHLFQLKWTWVFILSVTVWANITYRLSSVWRINTRWKTSLSIQNTSRKRACKTQFSHKINNAETIVKTHVFSSWYNILCDIVDNVLAPCMGCEKSGKHARGRPVKTNSSKYTFSINDGLSSDCFDVSKLQWFYHIL